jgi:hypothetical protein
MVEVTALFDSVRERLSDSDITRYIVLLGLICVSAVFFTEYVVSLGLVGAAVLTPLIVARLELKKFGFELITLATVLIGFSFGPVIGAVAGFLLAVSQMVVGRFAGIWVFWVIPSYAVAGFAAGALDFGIFSLGMIIIVSLHAFFSFMTFLFNRGGFAFYAIYGLTNIAFNFLLFRSVAPVLVGLM